MASVTLFSVPPTVSFDVGMTRLSELAQILDGATAYDQSTCFFDRDEARPACAYGYWLHHMHQKTGRGIAGYHPQSEFCINFFEAEVLFGSGGCGNAQTSAAKAAAYIRDFVTRKTALAAEAAQETAAA